MKYLRLIVTAIILVAVLLPAGMAVAANITAAKFHATIAINNSSGSTATGAAVPVTGCNITSLINGNWINSGATDLAVLSSSGADLAFQPGYNLSPSIIYVPTVGAGSIVNDSIYFKDVTGGAIRWFPNGTGGTITDALTEPGNNFQWTWKNLMLSATSTNATGLLNHQDSNGGYQIGQTASGKVSVSILNAVSTNTTYNPNAAGTNTALTASAGTNWSCVSDSSDATYVWRDGTSYLKDTYNIPNHTTESGTINSVTINFRIACDSPSRSAYAKPLFITHSTLYEGTEQSTVGLTYVNKSQTYNTNPFSSAAWTWSEIDALEMGVELKSQQVGDRAWCAKTWLVINYNAPVPTSTSISGLTPGTEISTLTVGLSGGSLSITSGATSNSTAFAGSVPNASANTTLCSSDTVLYSGNITYTKSGVVTAAYSWEYPSAMRSIFTNGTGTATGSPKTLVLGKNSVTVTGAGNFTVANSYGWAAVVVSANVTGSPAFCPSASAMGSTTTTTITATGTGVFTVYVYRVLTDQSVNSYDAVASFRTVTNNAYVSAVMSGFEPVTQATAPAWAIGAGPDFITSNLTANSTPLPVSGNGSLDYPGKAVIESIADSTGTPRSWPAMIIGSFLLYMGSALASHFLKNSGGQSLFVKSVVNIVGYGVLVALQIFDWWMIIFFFITEMATWFAAKERRE